MVQAVVGANWGDEGKGKITDMLAEKADIVIRFQGGSKRGSYDYQQLWKISHCIRLPSGVFYSHINQYHRKWRCAEYPACW